MGAARLARLGGCHESRQHRRVAGDAALDRIETRAHAARPLCRRVSLHLPHRQVPGVPERLPLVLREGGVVSGGPRGERVIGGGRVVVSTARVESGDGGEGLGIPRLEPGCYAQQSQPGILLAVLPGAKPGVEQLAPELVAVCSDVVAALRGEPGRAGQRAIGPRDVARLDVIAAQVIPRARVRSLVVLRDRFSEELPCLAELLLAQLRLLHRSPERLHPVFDLGRRGRELARWLWRHPATLCPERDGRKAATEDEQRYTRDGTHEGRR